MRRAQAAPSLQIRGSPGDQALWSPRLEGTRLPDHWQHSRGRYRFWAPQKERPGVSLALPGTRDVPPCPHPSPLWRPGLSVRTSAGLPGALTPSYSPVFLLLELCTLESPGIFKNGRHRLPPPNGRCDFMATGCDPARGDPSVQPSLGTTKVHCKAKTCLCSSVLEPEAGVGSRGQGINVCASPAGGET